MNDSKTGAKQTSRNVGLDLIRLVACMLVLGNHMRMPSNPSMILSAWNRGGWVGVDLFFVLSGFLVSSLLFREHRTTGAIDISRFLVRRGLKIYPSFRLMLAATITAYIIFRSKIETKNLLGEVLFVQNYIGSLWPHTWSLAVEEHFYIGLVGLFALLCSRAIRANRSNPFEHLPFIFVAVAVFCLGARILNFLLVPSFSVSQHLFMTHLRIDSLFFGVVLAYLVNYHALERRLERIPTWYLLATGGLLLSPAFVFSQNQWIATIGLSVFYFGSGLILIGALRLRSTSNIAIGLAATFGAASYSIYLWHIPINVWGYLVLEKAIGTPSFLTYLFFYLFGSLIVGFTLNQCFENVILRWRNRRYRSPIGYDG